MLTVALGLVLSLNFAGPGGEAVHGLRGFGASSLLTPAAVHEAEPPPRPGPTPASASGPTPLLARIEGRVVEGDGGAPVAGANVQLAETRWAQVTDSLGLFAFVDVPAGDYLVLAEATGFMSVGAPLRIAAGERLIYEMEIRLSKEAILLDPIVVRAPQSGILLEDLRDRLDWIGRTGLGVGMDRRTIEASGAIQVSHLLARLPGVRLVPTPGRLGGAQVRLSPLRDCQPSVYIDGIRSPLAGGSVDDLVSVGELEAVEVYRRLSDLPGEFADETARRCGAVVLTTRRGQELGEPFGWRRMLTLMGFLFFSYLAGGLR
jgi:hypothetical protein